MATTAKTKKYIEGIGRRKNAIARVRIYPGDKKSIVVNEKTLADYFSTEELQKVAQEALEKNEGKETFGVTVKVKGGGVHSQAESLRLGLSRALVKFNEENRKELKKSGFLKRDPRSKERKKFGLKKARKAAQWSKR